jgi:NADH-quinone oxidoreductase subunit J
VIAWAAFAVVAGSAVATAVGLVVRRNPLHGALFLVANLFCVAVLYLMLRAEFLALAQVVVYAGAIMVLFIFAIMLLIPGKEESGADPLRRVRLLALPFGGVFLGLVLTVLALAGGGVRAPGATPEGVAPLGRLLFTDYLFPFEVTSVLLLAALVGALALTRRRVP